MSDCRAISRGVPVGPVFIRSHFVSHLSSGTAMGRRIFASGGCRVEEVWHILPYGPDALNSKLFTIQSYQTGGFLRGHDSGRCDTVSNCDEWERWYIDVHPTSPGKFAIRSFHNTYLRCDDNATSVTLTKCVEAWEAWSVVGSSVICRGISTRKDAFPQVNQPLWLFGVHVVDGQVTNPTKSGLRAVGSLIPGGEDRWTVEMFGENHVAFKANDNTYLSGTFDRFVTGAAAQTVPPPCTAAELWKCVFLGPQQHHPLQVGSSSSPPPICANNVVFVSKSGKYVQCRDSDACMRSQDSFAGALLLGVPVPRDEWGGGGGGGAATPFTTQPHLEGVGGSFIGPGGLSDSNRQCLVQNTNGSSVWMGSSLNSSIADVGNGGHFNSTPLLVDTNDNDSYNYVSPPATMSQRQCSSDSGFSAPHQQMQQQQPQHSVPSRQLNHHHNSTIATTTTNINSNINNSAPVTPPLCEALFIVSTSHNGTSSASTAEYYLDCMMGKVFCSAFDDDETPPSQWIVDREGMEGSATSIGVFNSSASATKRYLRTSGNGAVSAPSSRDASSGWVIELHPSTSRDTFTIRSQAVPNAYLSSCMEFGLSNPVVKAVSREEQEPTIWTIFAPTRSN